MNAVDKISTITFSHSNGRFICPVRGGFNTRACGPLAIASLVVLGKEIERVSQKSQRKSFKRNNFYLTINRLTLMRHDYLN